MILCCTGGPDWARLVIGNFSVVSAQLQGTALKEKEPGGKMPLGRYSQTDIYTSSLFRSQPPCFVLSICIELVFGVCLPGMSFGGQNACRVLYEGTAC